MNARLVSLRKIVNQKITLKEDLQKRLAINETKLKAIAQKEEHAHQAHLILQRIAKETQEQLEYRISELGSHALSAVYDNPYTLRLIYEEKRSKTEAQLLFERNGHQINPLDSGGYGTVDIADFALRCSLWTISSERLDNVLVLDEPFKHINDITRKLHRNAVEMVKEISERLGLQFIIASHIPEFQDIADTIYEITQVDGTSYAKKIR